MEQLTTLDAGFLEVEDADRHISLAIGAVAVLNGPPPEFHSLLAAFDEWARKIPRCRQVLRTRAFDFGAPEWVYDNGFDIAHHVHRAAVHRPGDDAALFRLVADIMERRLDRDRPLWECWIIEGISGNQWAILMKVHHCIADGIAATRMLSGLCDTVEGGTFADRINAATNPPPPADRLLWLPLNPLSWVSGMLRGSVAVARSAVLAVEGAVGIAGGIVRPASASSLTGPVTTMRRYRAARVALDDVERICTEFDVTVNDVALAALTDSFRRLLIERGEQPGPDSLRTLVPVSVRTNELLDKTDNRVSVMVPCLPVDTADPVEQLRVVHRRLTRAKASGQRQAGSAFVAAANAIPFMVSAWAVRALTRLPQRGIVTLATNVPGPRQRLKIVDREVVRLLPVPPIAMQLRTGVAMLSYSDELVFGITADYDAMPDLDKLADGIESAVQRLVATSRRPWRSTGSGTLSLVQG